MRDTQRNKTCIREAKAMTISEISGLVLGVTIISIIQFTIGNPFIWMDEKIREYFRNK